MSDAVVVTQNVPESRFEARLDGHVATAAYELRGDVITFTHTRVPEPIEGHGVASTLIKAALDAARTQHLRVVAVCRYVQAYLERHPEYQDLVAR